MKLTAHQIRKVAVQARRDPRSVKAVYAGGGRDMVREDVREAAQELGLPPPSDPPPPRSAA